MSAAARMVEEAVLPRRVTFRPFLAGDAVQLQLQPSQHLTLGINSATISMEDALELEEMSVDCWTAIAGGRILACTGFRMLWPGGPTTNGHAVAWAMLAADKGSAFLEITRFLKRVVADCSLTRIEAITRKAIAAEGNWLRLLGFDFVAELPAWGPDGETHLLFQKIGPAPPQPGQPGDAGTAHPRLREEGAE